MHCTIKRKNRVGAEEEFIEDMKVQTKIKMEM